MSTIYLVQHGEPKSKEEDPNRPLTEKGKKDVAKTATVFKAAVNDPIATIFHSGKARSLETATILCSILESSAPTKAEGLAPMDDPQDWARKLSESQSPIMVVGHLPHLEKLASLLVVGKESPAIVRFEMGGVVAFKQDNEGAWRITGMTMPSTI